MSEMRITYQIQLTDNQTIAFEVGEDTEIPREELDRLLDKMGEAAARRKAAFDLPLHQESLFNTRAQLPRERKRLAEAEAKMQANVVAMTGSRSRSAPPAPQDIHALSEIQKTISNLEMAIRSNEKRIPFLKAVIAGGTPPELFPEANDDYGMAAE